MVYTQWLWIFITSALIQCMLVVLAFPRRNSLQGKAFLLLLACMLIWTVGFILETASSNLANKILFARIQFIGIPLLPVAWFFLAQTYIEKHMPIWKWVASLIIPGITILLALAIPNPNAFWGNPSIVLNQAPFAVVDYDYGIWFYAVHAPYGYLVTSAALIRLILAYRGFKPLFRKQLITMIIAFILPAATDVFYVAGLSPIRYYNFATAVFSISGLLLFLALFRYHLLDVVPMALNLVLDSMQDGLVLMDPSMRMIEMNPVMQNLAQLSRTEMHLHTGKSIESFMNTDLAQSVVAAATTRQTQTLHMDSEGNSISPLGSKTGAVRIIDLAATDVVDRKHRPIGIMVSIHDITEREQMLSRLAYLASHDDLTGMFNRRQILETGEQLLSTSAPHSPLSVAMMDIDEFKIINDTCGHETGDQTLVALSRYCSCKIQQGQTLGRMGGDEFLVLMPETSLVRAVQEMQALHDSIRSLPFPTLPENLEVTFSIGIASTEQFPIKPSLNTLLALADQSLYNAKEAGKNRIATTLVQLRVADMG